MGTMVYVQLIAEASMLKWIMVTVPFKFQSLLTTMGEGIYNLAVKSLGPPSIDCYPAVAGVL